MTSLFAAALVLVVIVAWIARALARRVERFAGPAAGSARTLELAFIGWMDWFLAGAAFLACLYATGHRAPVLDLAVNFFFGQVVGLASLIPGGFGSADAFWIARLPFDQNVTAAALTAYRFIYYIGPWCLASLLLLSWSTSRSTHAASRPGGCGPVPAIPAARPPARRTSGTPPPARAREPRSAPHPRATPCSAGRRAGGATRCTPSQ